MSRPHSWLRFDCVRARARGLSGRRTARRRRRRQRCGFPASMRDDAGPARPGDGDDGDAIPPRGGHGGPTAPGDGGPVPDDHEPVPHGDDAETPPQQPDDAPSTGRFFLPTGEPDNTCRRGVELDPKGGVHAVYPAYAGGRAYYAHCPEGCDGSDDVRVVRFDTDGPVANAMLALSADGQPRVLLATTTQVYFATCDADCDQSASWTTRMILDHAGEREVTGEALALDPAGLRASCCTRTARCSASARSRPRPGSRAAMPSATRPRPGAST